jgi:hypothetical protein
MPSGREAAVLGQKDGLVIADAAADVKEDAMDVAELPKPKQVMEAAQGDESAAPPLGGEVVGCGGETTRPPLEGAEEAQAGVVPETGGKSLATESIGKTRGGGPGAPVRVRMVKVLLREGEE